jgi:hypothetical protein
MQCWTIYRNPKDFQGSIIARRFTIDGGKAEPTEDFLIAAVDQLEAMRDEMRQRGLTRFARADSDDPAIVETWL